jgi:hypothetical protein
LPSCAPAGLDERSMRSARPVTGSTAEAIPDRCGWASRFRRLKP